MNIKKVNKIFNIIIKIITTTLFVKFMMIIKEFVYQSTVLIQNNLSLNQVNGGNIEYILNSVHSSKVVSVLSNIIIIITILYVIKSIIIDINKQIKK